uniref:Uncharacterized protein n=1 Tax=Anser brachyrhynchus TaxID=132585 RepID=A0A8B9BEM7_9AVES
MLGLSPSIPRSVPPQNRRRLLQAGRSLLRLHPGGCGRRAALGPAGEDRAQSPPPAPGGSRRPPAFSASR